MWGCSFSCCWLFGGVGGCFLCLHVCCPVVGVVGVGAFWGWAFLMDTLSGSRSIPVGRDAPSPSSSFSSFVGVVVGVCGLLLASCVLCVGLVVWWVVCDLYSGCEHLVCFVVLFSFVGHSVDALASRADEGRCGLRYASGSWRASVDPRVSEWGNLTRVVLGYHHLNVYRVVGGTRGSETS